MWRRLAEFVLRYRLILLLVLLGTTAAMAYFASKVKLSYEFAKAIPVDNPKYQQYQAFRQSFGDEGNLLVIAIKTDSFYTVPVFTAFTKLQEDIKKVPFVENVISTASAVNLQKDTVTQKLVPVPVFEKDITQANLDSSRIVLSKLPFYRGLLFNPDSSAYLLGVKINKDKLNSPARTAIVNNILKATGNFTAATHIITHASGLPLIRTLVADRIAKEMKWFLIGSLALSALILFLFFRSVATMLLSLAVVMISVIWSFGILYLFGYKITLLTALVPPLIVVIGIPNCIYFLNKYHATFKLTADKRRSLLEMVSKMGVVTLFCNISAAIGFAVFALTRSAVLKEFGAVAGVSIMLIFVISFVLLPAVLSYLPGPKPKEIRYLDNKWFTSFLLQIEGWVVGHKKWVYIVTGVLLAFSIAGMTRLKREGFIVDDLPKNDKIYTDLKFFEQNFKGVMPLEIVIDTKKRYGLSGTKALYVYQKMDSLAAYISSKKELSRPLSIPEGLKFVKQGFYEGDSANYVLPNAFDGAFVGEYLKAKGDAHPSAFSKTLQSFVDTSKQYTRMSVNMADVGTERLPVILNDIQSKANQLFDSTRYKVELTGTSITFLEGSRFIINGLKESIGWAFLLISLCMLYLFKSTRILLCSIIPNLIPLIITAGVMGWAGVRLKPSTVLIFSVALGIAIDITIRFLVNYKQELPNQNNNVLNTVKESISHTGLSILYTSIVLIAGFIIFCFSSFGGTQGLGWLTSITLLVATLTNLVLLPVLLLDLRSPAEKRKG